MAFPSAGLTRFPGGVGQFTVAIRGGVAGALTVEGIKLTDKILFAQAGDWDDDGDNPSVVDVTSRLSITANDQITLAAGDSLATSLVLLTFTRPVA